MRSRTSVGKANVSTVLVTCFDVDMVAFGAMVADLEFQKMNENYVKEIIPHSITPLNPPS
jgi:hypothetical protein